MIFRKKKRTTKAEGGLWETVKVVIQALLIALVIRTFFFQPFNIPSGSMKPTLLVGDYLFVDKMSYGYGPYSFSLSLPLIGTVSPPAFEGRIFADQPQRGDVVVFKLPSDNETDYIKRVIGLPGDTVAMHRGRLYVNRKLVPRQRSGDYFDDGSGLAARPIKQFSETLDNGRTHLTIDMLANSLADNTREYVVPSGHFFMMGDNRDNSTDSRFPDVGFVPFENLVGKATLIFFSHTHKASLWQVWNWPFVIRWRRLFSWVD